MVSNSVTIQFEQLGFAIVPQCVDAGRVEALCAKLKRENAESRAGRRNLLADSAFIREFATDELATILAPFASAAFFPVRALLFDKTSQTNWNVAWHQDLSIAVADRVEVDGFGGWSLKEGVWHVQPPTAILERMLTVRLHLDDCFAEHGPLRVLPASHRIGRLDAEAITACRAGTPAEDIHCHTGDALVMRPLLLHASSKATRPSRRRVLHVEFAAEALPARLHWALVTGLNSQLNSDNESPPTH